MSDSELIYSIGVVFFVVNEYPMLDLEFGGGTWKSLEVEKNVLSLNVCVLTLKFVPLLYMDSRVFRV